MITTPHFTYAVILLGLFVGLAEAYSLSNLSLQGMDRSRFTYETRNCYYPKCDPMIVHDKWLDEALAKAQPRSH
ncbi:hypothetical protein RJJ65_09705 [Rhizobium hidalgonense]|uniref:Uncharacterized protein n=1 Tax=Rhizobium hidalgonense TaxID=1538159 RepID=A0A2A6KEI0_9HYPH|nr:hypothetical protein [Rhizobium hidalgonense]MDR9772931.1 hypothetical protein [Rhizobium hidalgonense]MDR9813619.1 hypothetical protein [Rhizobium hidalgonense]MDR9822053.1 hypothetical protein [Rhizobium hidalgonense]PDT22948.1 hypothetical protein CO674_13380 [Rhizobium hidalgonense]PON01190.1 hypothetical protein ATY29_33870 [Rhizobium hidalgonense]